MNRTAAPAILSTIALLLAGCGAGAEAAPTAATATATKSSTPLPGYVTGHVSVPGWSMTDRPVPDGPCIAKTGFDDVREGGQVIIADDSGKTLAAPSLAQGVTSTQASNKLFSDFTCIFAFSSVVPAFDGDFVHISYGKRTPLVVDSDKLNTPIDLTIGIE